VAAAATAASVSATIRPASRSVAISDADLSTTMDPILPDHSP
jgi:hypothetical protein